MNLPHKYVLASSLILSASFIPPAFAEPETLAFLKTINTVTYDCPDPVHLPQLNELLNSETLTDTLRFELLVNKTHYQNCNGQTSEAQQILTDLINNPMTDKTARYFASATYQLGFTYDVQEQNERCIYYADALRLSEGRFDDIEMSSTLGLITNCPENGYADDSQRLAAYFSLLEKYAESDNYGLLAHIHNSIGLFFGVREQPVMAAEQYLKAHEMGQKVYTGSNRLSILISAITALLGSGQYDRAYEAIEEFEIINNDVGNPLTNFWYYLAKSGYYYRIDDIEALEGVLPQLAETLSKLNSKFYSGLYRWYSTVPCLHYNDTACLQKFVDTERSLSKRDKQYASYDYQKFLVRSYFTLGDLDAANEAYEQSLIKLDQIKKNQDGLAKVMGIANLYGKIYVLEDKIAAAERRKIHITIGMILFVLLVIFSLVFVIRKKHIARMALDPITLLLNSKTAIKEIANVDLPTKGKANALAIFDLGNFREVNRQVGSTKGDYVLQKIANTLTKVTRDNDILGRFAPEQFILCLTDIEEASAKSFFERVQSALESTFVSGQHGADISIRSSMSIYITNEKFDDLHTVLDDMLLSLSLKAAK